MMITKMEQHNDGTACEGLELCGDDRQVARYDVELLMRNGQREIFRFCERHVVYQLNSQTLDRRSGQQSGARRRPGASR